MKYKNSGQLVEVQSLLKSIKEDIQRKQKEYFEKYRKNVEMLKNIGDDKMKLC